MLVVSDYGVGLFRIFFCNYFLSLLIGDYFNCNLLYLHGSGVGYFCLIIIVLDVLYTGMSFTVALFNMRHFVNTPNLKYNGHGKDVYKNVDAGKWSFLEALGIARGDLGYHGDVQMCWKPKELSLKMDCLTLWVTKMHCC